MLSLYPPVPPGPSEVWEGLCQVARFMLRTESGPTATCGEAALTRDSHKESSNFSSCLMVRTETTKHII